MSYGAQKYYFDRAAREVRTWPGGRSAEGVNLWDTRDDALTEAQKIVMAEIDVLRELIGEFETQKTPKSRSLKSYLMTRNMRATDRVFD